MENALAVPHTDIALNTIVDSQMRDTGLPLTSSDDQARDAVRCLADRFNLISMLTPTPHGTLAHVSNPDIADAARNHLNLIGSLSPALSGLVLEMLPRQERSPYLQPDPLPAAII